MIKKLIIITGLGNVGDEYNNTRHNIGFYFIKFFSNIYKTKIQFIQKYNIKISSIIIGKVIVFLLIPITYMNISGNIISKYIKNYKINNKELILVHDDLNVKIGQAKIQYNSDHEGHKGVKSIIERLGNQKIYKLKIGISRPNKNNIIKKYVLSKIHNYDKTEIDKIIYKSIYYIEKFIIQKKIPKYYLIK